MHQVINTYEKWCSRLPTGRLNHSLCKEFGTGYEQAFIEGFYFSTPDQVVHSSESATAYLCCFCEWEETTRRNRAEVPHEISEGRLRFGWDSCPYNAAYKKFWG